MLQARFNFILYLAGILFISAIVSLAFGAVPLSVGDFSAWLSGNLGEDSSSKIIIESIRLPRVLLACTTGACLALCGAASQCLFRNPLADPSLIGVSAGAALGGSIVIFLGMGLAHLAFFESLSIDYPALHLSFISLGAFAGGCIAVFFVYRFASSQFGTSVVVMLLIGIAISAIAGSATQLLEYFSDDQTLRRMSLWRMGGLDGANLLRVSISFFVLTMVLVFLLRTQQQLNALLLGESEASHLGVNVKKLKRGIILVIAAGTGISVTLAGTIAFVGLVVPHFIRMLIGPNHRFLIPASALAGAILLLCSDLIARLVIAPSELPVGLVTSLIGAPVFIAILRKRLDYGAVN